MTETERRLSRLIQRRVSTLTPDVALSYVRALRNLQNTLSYAEIERRIAAGTYDQLFTQLELDTAFTPYSDQIQKTMERAFVMTAKDIPGVIIERARANIHFDVINPRILEAVRSIQTDALDTLELSVQTTVRETVSRRLALGEHPTAIARELRSAIGLAENQEQYIANFEAQLRAGDINGLKRKLVQDRTSASLLKILQSGKAIPEARIEAAVTQYRKAWIARNAVVNTKSVTFDSYRTAERESYASAIERKIIPADLAQKTWVHPEISKEPRPLHLANNGETVGFDEKFFDGSQIPGLGLFGCNCFARYSIKRATRTAA